MRKEQEDDMSLNSSENIFKLISSSSGNSTDIYWTPSKCILVLVPELLALVVFSVAIAIVYKGVEIDHPVYSVLLLDLVVPLVITAAIILASTVAGINSWKAVSSMLNMISLLYHHTSWAMLSVLRFLLVRTYQDFYDSSWGFLEIDLAQPVSISSNICPWPLVGSSRTKWVGI